jgi:hypothetical protein
MYWNKFSARAKKLSEPNRPSYFVPEKSFKTLTAGCSLSRLLDSSLPWQVSRRIHRRGQPGADVIKLFTTVSYVRYLPGVGVNRDQVTNFHYKLEHLFLASLPA